VQIKGCSGSVIMYIYIYIYICCIGKVFFHIFIEAKWFFNYVCCVMVLTGMSLDSSVYWNYLRTFPS